MVKQELINGNSHGNSHTAIRASIQKPATYSSVSATDDPANPAHYLQQRLIEIIADNLKLAVTDIDPNTALFDYGVDSIIGVGLIETINSHLNISLETADLFTYTDIVTLTNHIIASFPDLRAAMPEAQQQPVAEESTNENGLTQVQKAHNQRVEHMAAMLTQDLDGYSFSLGGKIAKAKDSNLWKKVLLTGCTGFLGIQILADLLARTDWTMYCLVRAENKTAARQKILAGFKDYDLPVDQKTFKARIHIVPVSYTHLTLPTIYSV